LDILEDVYQASFIKLTSHQERVDAQAGSEWGHQKLEEAILRVEWWGNQLL